MRYKNCKHLWENKVYRKKYFKDWYIKQIKKNPKYWKKKWDKLKSNKKLYYKWLKYNARKNQKWFKDNYIKKRQYNFDWTSSAYDRCGNKRINKRWRADEKEYVRKHYKTMTIEDIAKELDRSFFSIVNIIVREKLRKTHRWS